MKFTRIAATGVALASLAVAGQAQAATSATADVQAQILSALSVTVDPTDNVLNFGTIADGGITANQSIVVNPDGTRGNACPTNLVCGGTLNTPTFTVTGLTGLNVQVSFTNATETLTNTAANPGSLDNTMTVGTFTTSLGATNQMNLAGSGNTFTVGGTLSVGPGQLEGTYNGSVTVNVAYF